MALLADGNYEYMDTFTRIDCFYCCRGCSLTLFSVLEKPQTILSRDLLLRRSIPCETTHIMSTTSGAALLWYLCSCLWRRYLNDTLFFNCRPATQRLYWGLSLCTALAAAYTIDTGGGGSKMRSLRGGTVTFLGVSAMLPITHSIRQLGWDRAYAENGAGWYLAEGLSLLVGAGIFVSRLPERLSPGFFRYHLAFSSAFSYVCCSWWSVPCCCIDKGT